MISSLLVGLAFFLPPKKRLADHAGIQSAFDALVNVVTEVVSDGVSQEGGRFSKEELENMSAVGDLLSELGHGVATRLAEQWGHQEGSIFRRISPSLFTTREANDWNNFQGRYSMELKALGIHCEFFLYYYPLGLVLIC